MAQRDEITRLLREWGKGDRDALERLAPVVEAKLRQIARAQMRKEQLGRSLQTMGLVNEAYIKLLGQKRVDWRCRAQFFALVAELMRRVLVDYARSKQRIKRGGNAQRVPLSDVSLLSPLAAEELLDLDYALKELAAFDKRKSQVIKLRFFGGRSSREIAKMLNVSVSTVDHEWKLAKAWLRGRLEQGKSVNLFESPEGQKSVASSQEPG